MGGKRREGEVSFEVMEERDRERQREERRENIGKSRYNK